MSQAEPPLSLQRASVSYDLASPRPLRLALCAVELVLVRVALGQVPICV